LSLVFQNRLLITHDPELIAEFDRQPIVTAKNLMLVPDDDFFVCEDPLLVLDCRPCHLRVPLIYGSETSLLSCHQQADNETLLKVMSHSRRISDQARAREPGDKLTANFPEHFLRKKTLQRKTLQGTKLLSRGARI